MMEKLLDHKQESGNIPFKKTFLGGDVSQKYVKMNRIEALF